MRVLSGSGATILAMLVGCGRVHFDRLDDAGAFDAAPRVLTLGENTTNDIQDVTSDTYLGGCAPFVNTGAATHLHMRDGVCPTVPEIGLLRFELTGIPATSTLLEARLRLWVYNDNPQTGLHTLVRVLESWAEGIGDDVGMPGGATWTERQTGVPWTSAGCGAGSCALELIGTFSPSGSSAIPSDLALDLATVQGWVDGSVPNHGMAIEGGPIAPPSSIVSREGADAMRPTLVLTVQ